MGGAVIPPASGRQDRTRGAQLSLDWSPLRAVLLSASLQRDSRSSNQANLDFKASAANITTSPLASARPGAIPTRHEHNAT